MGFKKLPRVISLNSCWGKVLLRTSQGWTLKQIANELEVNVTSIYNFMGRNPDKKERYKRVKANATREMIEESYRRLGQGHEIRERTEEFIEERGGKVVKVKEKTTSLAPNLKALEALGNKYCPGEFRHVDRSESEVKVSITAEHRALSVEEKLGILLREKNGGQILELSADDYKVEESGRIELSDEVKQRLDP